MAGRVTPTVTFPDPTHDITITDPSGVVTGFMLYHNDEMAPGVHITYEPIEPPRSTQGPLRYSDVSPLVDLTWDIETFHLGGMSNRWSPNIAFRYNENAVVETQTAGRYNQAAGIVARTPGEFGLANDVYTTDMQLLNSSFAASAGWTLTGSASIGSSLLTLTTVGATATQLLNNPTAYANRAITLGAIVTVTGANATVRLGYNIDGGALVSTSTVVTGGAGATLVTHTATPGAIATSFRFSIDHSATATTTMTVSRVFIFNTNAIPTDLEVFNANFYATVGAAVLKYSAANKQWDTVLVGPEAATGLGISAADNKLVAGFGASGYYYYTAADPDTTWTSKTGPGGPYATVRGRIWGVKTPTGNTVSSSIDVVTGAGGAWTDYTVGVISETINNLFAYDDTLQVGRSDGLWDYDRGLNVFRDLTPEFIAAKSTENFLRAIPWLGWLYLAVRRGMLRFDGADIEDVSHEFSGPQIADFGGRIKALAIDGNTAWALMDTPTSDASTTKTTWLLSFTEILADNGVPRLIIHPTHLLTLGDFRTMSTFYDGTNTLLFMLSQVFVSGTTYYPSAAYMRVTTRHDQPDRDISPDLGLSTSANGARTITTQYWDAMLPDAQKAFIKLTFRVDGTASATKTVVVDYQLDESTTWVALGTVTATGLATLYFSTAALANRNGRRIRYRFTINTDSATLAPRVLCPIITHAVYRPLNFRHFEFLVYVADNLRMRNGQPDDNTASALMTTLDGYLNNNWVSSLAEDEAGSGTANTYNIFIRDAERFKLVDHPTQPGQRAWLYKIKATAQTTS